jgi:hypothetical protein
MGFIWERSQRTSSWKYTVEVPHRNSGALQETGAAALGESASFSRSKALGRALGAFSCVARHALQLGEQVGDGNAEV